jgi:hypothetical protein
LIDLLCDLVEKRLDAVVTPPAVAEGHSQEPARRRGQRLGRRAAAVREVGHPEVSKRRLEGTRLWKS